MKQVFFIGDGKTSTAATQQFVVPADATRLYLGTMDGFEWMNNSGEFAVTVNSVNSVPEPASFVMFGAGLAVLAIRRHRA